MSSVITIDIVRVYTSKNGLRALKEHERIDLLISQLS